MIRTAAVTLLLAQAPAGAMTVEACETMRRDLAVSLPPAGDLNLAREVTSDGWCRIEGGPLDGLEWRADVDATGFAAQFRRDRFEVEGLGEFAVAGQLGRTTSDVTIGPVALGRDDGDAMTLRAVAGAPSEAEAGLGPLPLRGMEFRVSGRNELVGDVLAWAFRTDIGAARSGFTIADDQRAMMLEWLDALPADMLDAASDAAFREVVEAYPSARGDAVIRVPEDRSVALGPLLAALLFGADFTEDAAAKLVRDAGLTFAWRPE